MTTAELEILINVADRDLKEAIRTLRTLTRTAETMGAGLDASGKVASRGLLQLERQSVKTAASLGMLDRKASSVGKSVKGHLAGLAQLLGGTVGTGVVASVALAGLKFDDLKQRATIAFTSILGGAKQARDMVANLVNFARNTPFTIRGIISTTQQLLAMGVASNKVIPLMKAIGDTVSALGGDQDVLERVVLAIGQIQSKGTVQAEEMRQLAQAGIPAWQLLAKAMGTSIQKAMKAVQKRTVMADFGIAALASGMEQRFQGMMEKQSHTFTGLVNKMKNLFQVGSGAFMEPFFRAANRGMESLNAKFSQPGGIAKLREEGRKTYEVFRSLGGYIKSVWPSISSTLRTSADAMKAIALAARQLNDVVRQTGIHGGLLELLLAGALASKTLKWAAAIAKARREAGGLAALLGRLGKFGTIVIGIELAVHRQSLKDKLNKWLVDARNGAQSWLDKHHLGFLGSGHVEPFTKDAFPMGGWEEFLKEYNAAAKQTAKMHLFEPVRNLTKGLRANADAVRTDADALAFWNQQLKQQRAAMKTTNGDVAAATSLMKAQAKLLDTRFGVVNDKVMSAFDAATTRMLEQLNVRVKVVGKGIKEAFTMKPGDKTPAERELDALDKLEEKRNYQRDIFDARHDLTMAKAIGDPRMIRDAQRTLEDGLTAKKRYYLEKRAGVERTAADKAIKKAQLDFQAARDLQKEALQRNLDDLKKALEKGHLTGEEARRKLNALLARFGVDLTRAGNDLGKAFTTGLKQNLDLLFVSSNKVYKSFKKIVGLKAAVEKFAKAAGQAVNAAATIQGGGGTGIMPKFGPGNDVAGIGANKLGTQTEASKHPKLAPFINVHANMAKSTPAYNRKLAAQLAKKLYGWAGAQLAALLKLGSNESGWVTDRINVGSGAFGIGQALGKTLPADYKGNPAAQITWMLDYIRSRYGTPAKALEFWEAQKPHYYAAGGPVAGTGSRDTVNAMLTPGEFVLSRKHLKELLAMLAQIDPVLRKATVLKSLVGALTRSAVRGQTATTVAGLRPQHIESLVQHTRSLAGLPLNAKKELEGRLAQMQAHPFNAGLVTTTGLGAKPGPLGGLVINGGVHITLEDQRNADKNARAIRRTLTKVGNGNAQTRRGMRAGTRLGLG